MNTSEIFVEITDQGKIDDLKRVLEKMNWEITWTSSTKSYNNLLHVLVPKENNTLCCEQSEVVERLSKYDWVSNVEISKLFIAYLS